jgi:hypothetical protein
MESFCSEKPPPLSGKIINEDRLDEIQDEELEPTHSGDDKNYNNNIRR